MQRQLARLRAFASAMARLYFGADRKVAILRGLEDRELSRRLCSCSALEAYFSLLNSLRCDLIRDIWAFSLDRDDRAPSIAHLSYELDDPATCGALSVEYAEARFAEWLDRKCGCARSDDHSPCIDYWSALLVEFDEAVRELRTRIQALLASDRARRLSLARNRGIAHYNMVKGRDKKHALFDLCTLELETSNLRLFLKEAEPVILELTRLLGGPAFDVANLRRVNRLQAEDLWERSIGQGEKPALDGLIIASQSLALSPADAFPTSPELRAFR